MIRFAENLNKMITAGLGGAMKSPSTEVAVGHRVRYMDASGAVASFETNIAAPIRSLRVDMQPIQEGSGDPSPDNVRPITGRNSVTVWREAVYDPSADPVLTIQLGQTVYGGTVDVTTGVLTVDRAMVDLGILRWYYIVSRNIFETDLVDAKPFANTEVATALCSQYVTKTYGNVYNNIFDGSIAIAVNSRVYVYDSAYTDATLFKQAMSSVQLCYELATPIEITLDPAAMSTLRGDNTVWSDAGDVTLEYPYYEETEGY